MEHGDSRQAGDRYTMRQVSELTGVPENTIRSWERRFGLPQPERSDGNQRRYSQHDAGIIRAIQGARDRGRTMEQAIEDVASDVGPASHSDDAADFRPDDQVATSIPRAIAPTDVPLVEALLSLDDGRAGLVLADALWGSSVETVCIDRLLPAWRSVEERHASGLVTDLQARFGHAWIERKLLSVFDQSNPEHGRQHLVVAAMHDRSGWLRSLGFAILLSRAGYAVMWLGDGVSVDGAVQAIDVRAPAAVLLVGESALSMLTIRETANRLRCRQAATVWDGLLAMGAQDSESASDAAIIPLHATQTAEVFERALNAWTPTRGTRQA